MTGNKYNGASDAVEKSGDEENPKQLQEVELVFEGTDEDFKLELDACTPLRSLVLHR